MTVKLTKEFTITYTGLIYPRKQQPLILVAVLEKLLRKRKIDKGDFSVRLYGATLDWLPRLIKDKLARTPFASDTLGIFSLYGKVSHTEAIKAQKESQLLWLLDWDDPNELGVHPGKIFEYLGARRPIIATGGVKGNVVDELIKETQSGYHAVDVGEVERVLLKCYSEWKQTGRVAYHGVGNERYTFREMTRKYVGLLND